MYTHYQDRRVEKLLQIENALADRDKEEVGPGVRFEDMLMSLGMDTDTVNAMIAVATKSNSPKVLKLFETLQEKSDNVNPVLQQILRTQAKNADVKQKLGGAESQRKMVYATARKQQGSQMGMDNDYQAR